MCVCVIEECCIKFQMTIDCLTHAIYNIGLLLVVFEIINFGVFEHISVCVCICARIRECVYVCVCMARRFAT